MAGQEMLALDLDKKGRLVIRKFPSYADFNKHTKSNPQLKSPPTFWKNRNILKGGLVR